MEGPRLCKLHGIDQCGSCFSDDKKKAAGKGRYRPPALRSTEEAGAGSGESEARRSLEALTVGAAPRAPPPRDVTGTLSKLLQCKKTALVAFRERDPCNPEHETAGHLSDAGHAAVTHLDGRELPEPIVIWAPLKLEIWTPPETGARLRAAALRGATHSVFRPARDGVFVTVFQYGPDLVSVRCAGAGGCFADAELARLVLAAPAARVGVAAGAQVTHLASGSRVCAREAPDYELALAPQYRRNARSGAVELLPAGDDLNVPLAESEATEARLDLRDDGRGLLSPRLGYWHFVRSGEAQLCATASGGAITVRHLPPAGFCALFADDAALQAAALRALREVEAVGVELTESVLRTHMGLSAAAWKSVGAAAIAFCSERPPLLCDLSSRRPEMVLLVGLPGAGKSSACAALNAAGFSHVRICQDVLGTRPKCLAAAEKALAAGRDVIIDRCNVSFAQRLPFLQLAAKHNCAVRAVVLQAPLEVCIARAVARPSHETIPGGDEHKARQIIGGMQRELVLPVREEGIHRVHFLETTHAGWEPQLVQMMREKLL